MEYKIDNQLTAGDQLSDAGDNAAVGLDEGFLFGQTTIDVAPLCLNQDLIDEGRDYFRKNYRDAAGTSQFLQDLSVSWQTFSAAIAAANAALTTPITLSRLAIKFIHRYDTSTNRWFLTAQLCQITGGPLPDANPFRKYEAYTLTSQPSYLNINDNGTITTESGTNLGFSNGYEYGIEYFNNVYYGVNLLAVGRNVQSATFAWAELQSLHDNNGSPARPDDTQFTINWASASSKTDLPSPDTYMEYPHCMVVYMSYSGTPCLDNNDVVLGNFYNRAADYNSLCPRRCGEYLCPIELVPTII